MNTFTYTGTESNLYDLLIWWGQLVPFEHLDDCEQDPGALHCCEGIPRASNALIGLSDRSTIHGEPLPIYFQFSDGKRAGMKYNLHPGDKIIYKDGKFSILQWFECVAISQDWP